MYIYIHTYVYTYIARVVPRGSFIRKQINTPLLRGHPDRLTEKSKNDTSFSRRPRACASDQPRVMVGLSGWSVFSGVYSMMMYANIMRDLRVMALPGQGEPTQSANVWSKWGVAWRG